MTVISQLQNNKRDLQQTRIATRPLPALREGEALLRISQLALTTNNITYAAFGETPHLRYWDFYPTHDADWFHMPAWGFAEVVESTVGGLAPGERFYGFWPVASHVLMKPVRVGERGFYDGAEHRLELTSAYNQYQRISTDAAYRAADEHYQMLLRPLFITSFMLADFLEDNDFFGARQVVVSSASSKTAYGTAFCLENNPRVELVGLTSAGNTDFVAELGCYARAVDYNQVESLDPSIPTLYVDFSGSRDLRARIHQHFGNQLVHDCYAGSAQSHEHINSADMDLPGPQPQPYFAPYQIKKRNADWGAEEVTRKFNAAQLAFIKRVGDAQQPWMQVNEHVGLEAAQRLVESLIAGDIDPKAGHAVVLD
ncbi:DUF2855 family protein [Aquipseudomonas ullengensis]|uniref:DUF2855 family protein n=1 Tax=Aquipseudomonas ullengensis TaxID=2759166 RepID=A0A7W4LKE2_9GAMM|nr:DUF2855 family protein [Pseudomonas ullengensis]MBB2494798.1 DUF2855 family protein [Pseudomonas ullengensis]